MKLLLFIPFQLEAVKRKTVSGLNKWAVMFWSWEQLRRQLWNLHAFCPHLIKIECPDSFTRKRQVQSFSSFIIFVAYLISLLSSMLYGYLKQHITSLTSVPVSEASHGKFSNVNIHDSFLPRNHLKGHSSGNRVGVLSSNMRHIYRSHKPKCFCSPLLHFMLRLHKYQCIQDVREGILVCTKIFSHTTSISVSLSLSICSLIFFLQLENK